MTRTSTTYKIATEGNPFFWAIFVALAFFKIIGAIDWPWVVVLFPLWGPQALFLSLAVLFSLIGIIAALLGKEVGQ